MLRCWWTTGCYLIKVRVEVDTRNEFKENAAEPRLPERADYYLDQWHDQPTTPIIYQSGRLLPYRRQKWPAWWALENRKVCCGVVAPPIHLRCNWAAGLFVGTERMAERVKNESEFELKRQAMKRKTYLQRNSEWAFVASTPRLRRWLFGGQLIIDWKYRQSCFNSSLSFTRPTIGPP